MKYSVSPLQTGWCMCISIIVVYKHRHTGAFQQMYIQTMRGTSFILHCVCKAIDMPMAFCLPDIATEPNMWLYAVLCCCCSSYPPRRAIFGRCEANDGRCVCATAYSHPRKVSFHPPFFSISILANLVHVVSHIEAHYRLWRSYKHLFRGDARF